MNIIFGIIAFAVGFAVGSVCGVVVTSFYQIGKVEEKINNEEETDNEENR